MIAAVNDRLRDIERPHTLLHLFLGGQHELVHARAVVRKIVSLFQFVHQIVRVQDGILAHADQAGAAEHEDVRVRLQHNAEVAVERSDVAD